MSLPDTIYQQGRCMICGAAIGQGNPDGPRYDAVNWKEMHSAYHENMVSREEARQMSSVRWCDNGDHPFRAGLPGAQSGVVQEINDDGVPVMKEIDVCPDHTQKGIARASMAAEKRRKELDAETYAASEYGTPDGGVSNG